MIFAWLLSFLSAEHIGYKEKESRTLILLIMKSTPEARSRPTTFPGNAKALL